MGTAAYAIEFLTALPQLIQAGIDVQTLIADEVAKLSAWQKNGTEPAESDWDGLNAKIKVLRDQLAAP